MGALSNENHTMTVSEHHSMIGDPKCTNSTTATVKCACAAAAVVNVFGLQMDRRLEHFAFLASFSILVFTLVANISSIRSKISHQETSVFSPLFFSLGWCKMVL